MRVSACACAATLCSNITPTWCVDQPVAHAARRPPPPAAVALLTGVCAREFSPATGDDDDADGGWLVFAQVTVSRGMDEVKTLEKRFSEVRARRGERRLPCRLCMVLIASR
jgi:hypothetical protein